MNVAIGASSKLESFLGLGRHDLHRNGWIDKQLPTRSKSREHQLMVLGDSWHGLILLSPSLLHNCLMNFPGQLRRWKHTVQNISASIAGKSHSQLPAELPSSHILKHYLQMRLPLPAGGPRCKCTSCRRGFHESLNPTGRPDARARHGGEAWFRVASNFPNVALH